MLKIMHTNFEWSRLFGKAYSTDQTLFKIACFAESEQTVSLCKICVGSHKVQEA